MNQNIETHIKTINKLKKFLIFLNNLSVFMIKDKKIKINLI